MLTVSTPISFFANFVLLYYELRLKVVLNAGIQRVLSQKAFILRSKCFKPKQKEYCSCLFRVKF
jgi:hypothetical protein